MEKIKAFILGIREFRLSVTTSYEDYEILRAYELGRDFAHKITLRRWDEI